MYFRRKKRREKERERKTVNNGLSNCCKAQAL